MPIIISWGTISDTNLARKETLFAAMIALILSLSIGAMACVYIVETKKKIDNGQVYPNYNTYKPDGDLVDNTTLYTAFIIMAIINFLMALFAILVILGVCMVKAVLFVPWLVCAIPYLIVNTVCGIIIAVPAFKDGKAHQGILYIFIWIAVLCLGIIVTSYIYDHYKLLKKNKR